MKTIAHKLWTEPAFFISAVVAVLNAAQTTLPLSTPVHLAVGLVLLALGGHQIRGRVTPVPKPG